MTAPQITPGPWSIDGVGLVVALVPGDQCRVICDVRTNRAANAKAIAAVPKMIEALQFYAKNWQANGDGDASTPGLGRSWMEPNDDLAIDEGFNATEVLREAGVLPQEEAE